MNGRNYTDEIAELSATERVFTTAQALRFGIPRNVLSVACASGKLERIAQGAYRAVACPVGQCDALEAAWKLTASSKLSAERVNWGDWDGIVVAGTTAAAVLDIGDFYMAPYRFLAPKRINSRNREISFGVREVAREDVTFEHGFPVTKEERTLVDLVLDNEDPSLARNAFSDACARGINRDRLAELVETECKGRKLQIAREVFREVYHGV